ncbi:MAG: hypothetical protein RLZZ241_1613 [Bacteroidota bacterium]|jgi:nitrogen fixation-related uncharacterized protein
MKEKVQEFLDSELLENYLTGACDPLEKARVEHYLACYPEVREAYNTLQLSLESYVKNYAVKPPKELKTRILLQISREQHNRKRQLVYMVAASIAILFFAGSAFFFWRQNNALQFENALVQQKIRILEANMKEQLEDVRNQFILLNNPETQSFQINGNGKARELKAVAYINPVKKLSYINVKNLPNLPENQDYQMWAEVNGEMVNLGVLRNFENADKMLPLPYGEQTTSYITIESKGGNPNFSEENIVANFVY